MGRNIQFYSIVTLIVLCFAVSCLASDDDKHPKIPATLIPNNTTTATTHNHTTTATTHNHTTHTTAATTTASNHTSTAATTTGTTENTTATTTGAVTGTTQAGNGTSNETTGAHTTQVMTTTVTPRPPCPKPDTSSLVAAVIILAVLCGLLFLAVLYLFIRTKRLSDQFRYSHM